jgi:hypothetical protein
VRGDAAAMLRLLGKRESCQSVDACFAAGDVHRAALQCAASARERRMGVVRSLAAAGLDS